jgi:lantibiotic leader peptide-processing serine protease
MRRFRPVFFGIAAIVGFAACSDHTTTPAAPEDASFSGAASSLETTGQHLVMFNAQRVPANFAVTVARSGGSVVAAYDQIGVAVVSGLSESAASALSRDRDVSLVTPDYLLPLELPADVATDEVAAASVASPENPAAAFFFPRQWNMLAIDAPQAWAAGFLGSSDVTVAILDTGIGYTHADLAGLVDLDRSASFVPSDDALVAAFFPGAHPVADLHWHGTHVGATVSSNAFAAAGVTSRTTLIGVKVCGVGGTCPTSGVLAGVMYAADQGADVINMSLGGLFLRSANPGFVSIINRAFTHANRAGTVVVVAAGNANTDLDRNIHPTAGHLPSLYAPYCDTSTTVCVSATGPATAQTLTGPWTGLDTRAEYSNFGRSAIDVAAPGGRFPVGITDIGGLVWAACSPFSVLIPVCQTGTFVVGATGTSMASPHAAGVAALLVNRHGNNVGRVRTAIHRTADDVGPRGTDPFFGKGRVNAFQAATGG